MKKKGIIDTKEETLEKLDFLKKLVSKKIISKETAEKLKDWKSINEKEIIKMFNKIDEIEDIKNVDKYFSKQYRITKEQYLKALENWVYRVQTITKLDIALIILSEQINSDSSFWLNLFSGFLIVLDKNLILLQENNIDIKTSLEEIWKDNKENNKVF